jgi:hypothetical protein
MDSYVESAIEIPKDEIFRKITGDVRESIEELGGT